MTQQRGHHRVPAVERGRIGGHCHQWGVALFVQRRQPSVQRRPVVVVQAVCIVDRHHGYRLGSAESPLCVGWGAQDPIPGAGLTDRSTGADEDAEAHGPSRPKCSERLQRSRPSAARAPQHPERAMGRGAYRRVAFQVDSEAHAGFVGRVLRHRTVPRPQPGRVGRQQRGGIGMVPPDGPGRAGVDVRRHPAELNERALGRVGLAAQQVGLCGHQPGPTRRLAGGWRPVEAEVRLGLRPCKGQHLGAGATNLGGEGSGPIGADRCGEAPAARRSNQLDQPGEPARRTGLVGSIPDALPTVDDQHPRCHGWVGLQPPQQPSHAFVVAYGHDRTQRDLRIRPNRRTVEPGERPTPVEAGDGGPVARRRHCQGPQGGGAPGAATAEHHQHPAGRVDGPQASLSASW